MAVQVHIPSLDLLRRDQFVTQEGTGCTSAPMLTVQCSVVLDCACAGVRHHEGVAFRAPPGRHNGVRRVPVRWAVRAGHYVGMFKATCGVRVLSTLGGSAHMMHTVQQEVRGGMSTIRKGPDAVPASFEASLGLSRYQRLLVIAASTALPLSERACGRSGWARGCVC